MVKTKKFKQKIKKIAEEFLYKTTVLALSMGIVYGSWQLGKELHKINKKPIQITNIETEIKSNQEITPKKEITIKKEITSKTNKVPKNIDPSINNLLWNIDRAWENKVKNVCKNSKYNSKACESVKKYKENAENTKHEGWEDLIDSALKAEDKIKNSVLPYHMRNNHLIDTFNVLMLISIAAQEVTNSPPGGRTYETTKKLFDAQNLATLPSMGDKRYSIGVYQTLYDTYNTLRSHEKVYKKSVNRYEPLLTKKFEENTSMYDQTLAALYLTFDNLSNFNTNFFKNCKKCKSAWDKASDMEKEDFIMTTIAMSHNSGINEGIYKVYGEIIGDGGKFKANTEHTIKNDRPSLNEITSKLKHHSIFSNGGRITHKHVINTKEIYHKLRERKVAMR